MEVPLESNTGFHEITVKVEEEEVPCSLDQSEPETSSASTSGFSNIIIKEEDEDGNSSRLITIDESGIPHTVIKTEREERPQIQQPSVETSASKQQSGLVFLISTPMRLNNTLPNAGTWMTGNNTNRGIQYCYRPVPIKTVPTAAAQYPETQASTNSYRPVPRKQIPTTTAQYLETPANTNCYRPVSRKQIPTAVAQYPETQASSYEHPSKEVLAVVHPLETVMSKKRKIDAECRIFNERWTHDYFFIQCKERAVCLLCQDSVAVFKEYNLRRHYESRHKERYEFLVGDVRKEIILKLKNGWTSRQDAFVKQEQLNISSMRASFQVAKLIARTGRLFIDGEFVKECLLYIAREMCPEKTDLFSTLSLSGPIIAQRIEEMGDNLHQHLQNSSKNLCYFSLALYESSDVSDSAQLLIFIRGTDAHFVVTEELAALQSIKGTTTGEDIYEKVRQTVNDLELDWARLVGVTTDGAPSMVGSVKGVVARINQEMDKWNYSRPIAIHCFIHQQAMCCKSLKWDSVMKVVVFCVNFIKAHASNHRQFREFLSELNAAYEDILYHTEVHWLSRGKVLKRFYDLLPQVSAFLLSKNKEVPELKDAEWKWHLAFLTDITELLNNFSVQLQGKEKLICDMHSHVKAFEVKLNLLIKQVKEENFCHLPTTQKLLAEKPRVAFPNKKCVDSLEMLQREFQMRFNELHFHEQDIKLFRNPFSVDIEIADPVYQMELAELQSCDSLKDIFKLTSLTNFYASLPPDTFLNLRNHALKMATIFGNTYVYEQTFSRMKHLNSPIRSRLTDAHLQHLLRLAVTNMEPDIDYLISQKQAHTSH